MNEDNDKFITLSQECEIGLAMETTMQWSLSGLDVDFDTRFGVTLDISAPSLVFIVNYIVQIDRAR